MKHSLDKAIALHKKHMKGTAPTTMKSQMEMMKTMKDHKMKEMKPKKKKNTSPQKKKY